MPECRPGGAAAPITSAYDGMGQRRGKDRSVNPRLLRQVWRAGQVSSPLLRSTSRESRDCCSASPATMAPVVSSIRSASVDLPWSTCEMMLKFRTRSVGMRWSWLRI
eukprot:scaffold53060_cov29-Tisochrysis_lutea.AAC.1